MPNVVEKVIAKLKRLSKAEDREVKSRQKEIRQNQAEIKRLTQRNAVLQNEIVEHMVEKLTAERLQDLVAETGSK